MRNTSRTADGRPVAAPGFQKNEQIAGKQSLQNHCAIPAVQILNANGGQKTPKTLIAETLHCTLFLARLGIDDIPTRVVKDFFTCCSQIHAMPPIAFRFDNSETETRDSLGPTSNTSCLSASISSCKAPYSVILR